MSPNDPEQKIDPVLLRRLHDRLIELRRSDASLSADAVLEELHPAIRVAYERPLRQMLGDETPSSSLDMSAQSKADGSANEPTRQDEWTVELPTGFKAEPVDLPPAKRPSASAEPHHDSGQVLPEYVGKFRVKGELGRGANGVVYLGFDEELNRNVAIKLSLVSSEKLQRRLRVEASKAAQVEATGIVPIHHIGTTESGAVYIVQKYIEGSTLRAILKNGGPLSPARGVRLIREIAVALDPAHAQDILHRDLKPDNILIDRSGKAWISDFGLAISEEEQQGRRSELAGTPAYMSPEQIKGRVDFLDPRSDIWAMGVMFYEVLTGKLPFSGKNRKSLSAQICERDPRPMQQRAPQHLTAEMNDVFNRCCAKKPSARFASTGELIGALDDLIDGGLSEHNINGKYVSTTDAESLFDYETASGRDSVSTRGSVSSVRTERATAKRETLRGSRQEPAFSRPSLYLYTAACILLTAVVVFWVTRGPGAVTVAAEGTAALPWIVAIDGSGSHDTIQAAIDASVQDAFIRVDSAEVFEAIEIRKSVTILGGLPDRGCVIRSLDKPVITINCPGQSQLVTLKNLTISGRGDPDGERFNTIAVFDSAVTIENCEVSSRTQNCLKARNGSMEFVNSTFESKSSSRAVSLTDHQKAVFTDCRFFSGGVELTRGGGSFSNCFFQKGSGVSVYGADSGPVVYLDGCEFIECDVGLEVHNQVQVVAGSQTRFERCGWGAMLRSLDDSKPGILKLNQVSFRNCQNAVYVVGGDLETDPRCEILDCVEGVFVEAGNAVLNGLHISGGSVGASVGVKKKSDVGEIMIRTGPATASIRGGAIERCLIGLDTTHPNGSVTVTGTKFRDNKMSGISYRDGELFVEDAKISGGERGIFAKKNDRFAEISVVGSSFDNHSQCDVMATGSVTVMMRDCKLSAQDMDRLQSNAPATITVDGKEPD